MFKRIRAAISKTFFTWARLGLNEDEMSRMVFGMDKDVLLSTLFMGSNYFLGQYDYYNDRKELLDNFQGWAFLVSDKYAKAVMECSDLWGLYQKQGSGEKLIKNNSTGGFLYDVRYNCNPSPVIIDYKTTAAMMYLGNSQWYMPLNVMGKPSEINFIEPQWGTMRVVKDRQNNILRYVLLPALGVQPINFEKETILHFYYPSISSGDYGRAPSNYIKSTYDLDAKYKTFSNSMIDNQSVPPFALSFPKQLTPQQRSQIEKALQNKSGSVGVGQALILDNDAKIQTIFANPKEMDFMRGKEMNRDEAFQINSIPKSVGGVSDSTNRADAEAGIYVFYRLGLKPFLNLYADFQTRGLFQKYDPRIVMKYDDVVPEDLKLEAEVNQILVQSGQMTLDEVRAEKNRKEYDNGIGKEPLLNGRYAMLKDIVAGLAATEVAKGGQDPATENENTNNA